MAKTIDEVITQLTDIIDYSRREQSRLGYFAALYRRVTISVKEGIAQGRFQDGERMACLDVFFANRYLEAYELYRQGQRPTQSWQIAFDAAQHWRPLILQHLLVGINAHINLDLGIAAVKNCPGDQLSLLQHDFDQINLILASLVQSVEDQIGALSPWIGFLAKIDPSVNDAVINFSMRVARNDAWKFALKLNALSQQEQDAAIQQRDQEIACLGHLVHRPVGIMFNINLLGIRLRETNNIPKVIDALC